jgi:hypothetical protein
MSLIIELEELELRTKGVGTQNEMSWNPELQG